MKLWQKKHALNPAIEAFTVGNDYQLDDALVPYDCAASIAHAEQLVKMGILTQQEGDGLSAALQEIVHLHHQKKFVIQQTDEDCHTAIENFLTTKLGDTGKKIHTGRSRNDQVLTALRLFYKDKLKKLNELTEQFNHALSSLKKKHGTLVLPGYTHTRKAMPSSVALWCDAFIDSMEDNKKLLDAVAILIDQSPLGTGAGYGVPLQLDRSFTAKKLGFSRVQENPIYAQNSRGKFESSLIHAVTQILFDLNKMASDLILFSMPEFGYFILPPEFCTGSSIMPQKKNPDVLELVRGKYAVVLACEFEIKTINSNIISGYNRDMQLLKEPTFRALETTMSCLNIMSLVVENLSVDAAACERAMTPELFATHKAYELVKKGVPFREAYQTIAKEFEEK